MKLTFLLVLLSFMGVFASEGYSQTTRLTLSVKELRLEDFLIKIEDQSEFRFFYTGKINVEKKVSGDFKNRKITEILDEIGEEAGIVYEIMGRQIILSPAEEPSEVTELQQQKTISGKVTDTRNQPLPGVTVVVKGTTQGTVTNADGEYSISNIPTNTTLQFSFVGMTTQEIVVDSQTNINVTLEEETIGIEEVVAIGYGTQKKSHLTAAVDQISGVTLEDRPLRSIADGLQGMVAGLNVRAPSGAPEATLDLNIRGFTGFETSAQPLILVDGIERAISDINANDVESISVLKDGAASAIYGSRAPYGVVLITTKSGKKGEKMKLKYSANFDYGIPSFLPGRLNSYEWAELINEAYRNTPGGGTQPYFSELTIARMKAFANGDFGNSVFDGLNPEQIPYGTFARTSTLWADNQNAFGNTDWGDLATKNIVPSQNHNLSVAGGGENTSYYMGLGYNENNGMFIGNDYKKIYSTLLKIDNEITDWLSINMSANYVRTGEEGVNWRGGGRNYADIFNHFARWHPSNVTTNPNGSYNRVNLLPNLDGTAGTESRLRNDITLSGGAVIEPFKDFKINGNYTWRNNTDNYNKTTYCVYQTLPDGNQSLTGVTAARSSIIKSTSNIDYYTINLYASYSKTLNDVHNFHGLVGFQEEENGYSYLQGSASDFVSDKVPSISTSSSNYETKDVLYDWATRGYFSRFSYNFSEKYFIEFNARRDATSKFQKSDRWGFFPSVSVAWNVARENFWPLNFVTLFKPRSSWTTSGDASSIGNYAFYPTITINKTDGVWATPSTILDGEFVSYASAPYLVSSQLTWAKPTTLNMGVDVLAFKNRLEINYDWYQRTVKDQFGPPFSVPATIGTDVPLSNNAISETRGWEISLKWKDNPFNFRNKPFHYSIQFRMSDYVGYVVKYESDGTGARNGQWIPGEIFGQNYHYVSNGIMQNVGDLYTDVQQGGSWFYPGDIAMADVNGDGEINSGTTGTWYSMGDRVKDGFDYPRYCYGITLGAEWNNFNLSLLFDGVGHWKKYSTNMYVWGVNGNVWFAPYFKENAELGYWSPNDTDAFYPRNMFDYKNISKENNQYALDLSHLRIRNIKFGYETPKVFLERVGLNKVIDSIYAYVSAENLGFIYYNSFIKMEPELLGASDGVGYPALRHFSFGVNVEF